MVQRLMVQPPSDWHDVPAIYVGGCIEGTTLRPGTAHAHNAYGEKRLGLDGMFGLICAHSLADLGRTVPMRASTATTGAGAPQLYHYQLLEPSILALHEYAHILNPDRGHDYLWQRTLRGFGQTIAYGSAVTADDCNAEADRYDPNARNRRITPDAAGNFLIGDRVVVTGGQKRMVGMVGTVTRVLQKRVQVEFDHNPNERLCLWPVALIQKTQTGAW